MERLHIYAVTGIPVIYAVTGIPVIFTSYMFFLYHVWSSNSPIARNHRCLENKTIKPSVIFHQLETPKTSNPVALKKWYFPTVDG